LKPCYENPVDFAGFSQHRICHAKGLLAKARQRSLAHFQDRGVAGVKLGASWEGFALEEIIRLTDASEEEAYIWSVHCQGKRA